MLKKAELNCAGSLGDAVALGESANCLGRVSAAAQAAYCGHTRVVPAGDTVFFNELAQLALGHNRVVDAESCKLDLARLGGNGTVFNHPVVERTVILKFERAERMGDMLHSVLNGVGEIIHGVDAPLVAGAVVSGVVYAVDNGVAHIEVAAGKVNFGAKRHFAVFKFARAHTGEKV